MTWNNTIKAVKLGDGHQWAIGDALKRDKANGVNSSFAECSKKLNSLGFTAYTPQYLSNLHNTAVRFPKNDRDPNIAWGAHNVAGNPENLSRAAEGLRGLKKPKTISEPNVRWIMEEWRKAAEQARQKKKDEAKKRIAAAGKKKAAAGRRKLSATDESEREAAKADFAEAKQEVKEAIEQLQLIPNEPLGHDEALDPETMPEKNDLQRMALFLKIDANAKLMLKTIESDLEALAPELDQATAANLNTIIKRYSEIKAAVDNLLATVRKHGFKIVQGGTA